MDQETLTLTWASGEALLAELRQLGGNVDPRRFAGLRTPRWRSRLAEALEARPARRAARDSRSRWSTATPSAPRRAPRVAAETALALDDMRAMIRAAPPALPEPAASTVGLS